MDSLLTGTTKLPNGLNDETASPDSTDISGVTSDIFPFIHDFDVIRLQGPSFVSALSAVQVRWPAGHPSLGDSEPSSKDIPVTQG